MKPLTPSPGAVRPHIAIARLIRLMELSERDGCAQVICGGVRGELWFARGALVDAAFDGGSGELAVTRMLNTEQCTYEIVHGAIDRPVTLGPEAQRRLRRALVWRGLLDAVPPLDRRLSVDPLVRNRQQDRLDAKDEAILALVGTDRTIGEVVDQSQFGAVETLDRIARHLRRGLLRSRAAQAGGEAAPTTLRGVGVDAGPERQPPRKRNNLSATLVGLGASSSGFGVAPGGFGFAGPQSHGARTLRGIGSTDEALRLAGAGAANAGGQRPAPSGPPRPTRSTRPSPVPNVPWPIVITAYDELTLGELTDLFGETEIREALNRSDLEFGPTVAPLSRVGRNATLAFFRPGEAATPHSGPGFVASTPHRATKTLIGMTEPAAAHWPGAAHPNAGAAHPNTAGGAGAEARSSQFAGASALSDRRLASNAAPENEVGDVTADLDASEKSSIHVVATPRPVEPIPEPAPTHRGVGAAQQEQGSDAFSAGGAPTTGVRPRANVDPAVEELADAWDEPEAFALTRPRPSLPSMIDGADDAEAGPAARRPSRQPPSATGVVLGGYEVLFRLARGGMGSVYLCRRTAEGGFSRLFALKVLREHLSARSEWRQLFLEEARIMARLYHPNVIGIVDVGTHDDQSYIVMDYVEGCSLAELLRRNEEARPARVVIPIILDALAGLHAAHTQQSGVSDASSVVHCDVSPQNLMVGADGVCRVSDFGVAKVNNRSVDDGATTSHGKPAYLAPEQLLNGSADVRSDVYSMGVVLWNALSGESLFDATERLRLRESNPNEAIPPPSTSRLRPPPVLDEVCLKALQYHPEGRFQSALEMIDALRAVALQNHLLGSPAEVAEWVEASFGRELRARRRRVAEGVFTRQSTEIETDPGDRPTLLPILPEDENPPHEDRVPFSETMVLRRRFDKDRVVLIVAICALLLLALFAVKWPSTLTGGLSITGPSDGTVEPGLNAPQPGQLPSSTVPLRAEPVAPSGSATP